MEVAIDLKWGALQYGRSNYNNEFLNSKCNVMMYCASGISAARPLVLSKTYTIEARTVTLAAHLETNLSLLKYLQPSQRKWKKRIISQLLP